MRPHLTHLLTPAASLQDVRVACGTTTPDHATWLREHVTCQLCLRPPRPACTCGPLMPLCPACRAWNATQRGRPTTLPALRTEKAFQAWVQQEALAAGWMYHHVHDSRHSPAGYPDTTLVRETRLVFAELKMPGKRPTMAQQAWLDALAGVTQVQSAVWNPDDLETILEVLR
jgi:hypothetical protein